MKLRSIRYILQLKAIPVARITRISRFRKVFPRKIEQITLSPMDTLQPFKLRQVLVKLR
ncbi:hypothetical protein [Paenibacillus larvae]|uniref:hypothetical protein n=1 Tax=Paenibacillus larvae TaxID=1464 RepID=UPI0018DD7304|nr:hypothetical protein [Paenibacillus larvae]